MLAPRVGPLVHSRFSSDATRLSLESLQRHDAPPVVPAGASVACLRLRDHLRAGERMRNRRPEKRAGEREPSHEVRYDSNPVPVELRLLDPSPERTLDARNAQPPRLPEAARPRRPG